MCLSVGPLVEPLFSGCRRGEGELDSPSRVCSTSNPQFATDAGMQRYGLQLRTKPAASSSSRPPPPARPIAAFADDDDDDVEADILRQSSKKRALQKVEELQKKAIEEDPSVFAYDDVYDDMKEKAARPKIQAKVVRQSKYIEALKEKAEQRKREQDIVYERKLHKERSKEDHLFADKDKFVTSAYRKKLEEEQKWLEEERRRQLQEEKDDVTKKKDLSDFYFGLAKNVAFGARTHDGTEQVEPEKLDNNVEDIRTSKSDAEGSGRSPKRMRESSVGSEKAHESRSVEEPATTGSRDSMAATSTEKDADVAPTASQVPQPAPVTDEHYKRSTDALAAARERALARKRAKEQQL
ncbi:nuclear speckle splicing regulatory protein 1 [Brachypodium distachyon]|nr:nuclear speckle splicing regulatory protein 1 [Brachypodium distachyon]|eukprot:XP_003579807.2 nuclear speckle splicing regulatory protein 1 [Brachypodium distachyon]